MTTNVIIFIFGIINVIGLLICAYKIQSSIKKIKNFNKKHEDTQHQTGI